MMSRILELYYVFKENIRNFLQSNLQQDSDYGIGKPSSGYTDLDGQIPQSIGHADAGSVESLASPDRPPLRKIDQYVKPEIPCLSKRYTVAILTCMGFIITFGMRCNIGMAKLQGNDNGSCVQMDGKNVTCTPSMHQMFNYSVAVQSMVEGSFFWGYLITQVPGGFLASMFPANRLFGIAVATSSALNLLVPAANSVNASVLIFVKVLQGLVEGVTYPACHGIWRHWAPPLERSRLATIALCGSYAGVVIGMPLSGILIQLINAQSSFYFYGVMGLIWFAVWNWLVFEKPNKHPTISARELMYIEKSLEESGNTAAPPTIYTTPWYEILHSMPVYAIVVANFSRSWNFFLLLLYQASYMSDRFKRPVAETGLVGCLPHLFMTLIVPSGGLLADHLRKEGILSTTMVRKIFNCAGFGMEAFFFLVVACTNDYATSVVALIIGVSCSGFAISGFNVNHLDIAPRYASILMGISNGVGTFAGAILPFVVDSITQDHSRTSWSIIFVLAATVHIIGVTFYGTFASGELQPWAIYPQEKPTELDDLAISKINGNSELEGKHVISYGSVDTRRYSDDSTSRESAMDVQGEEGVRETFNPFRSNSDTNPFRCN